MALDTLFLKINRQTVLVPNMLDHRTNFQVATRRKRFDERFTIDGRDISECQRQNLLTDGATEFNDEFERGMELLGALHMVTNGDGKWSLRERRAGLLQSIVEKLADMAHIENTQNLEVALAEATVQKNRSVNRGGFSPSQLVFGVHPRVAAELLTDDALFGAGEDELRDPSVTRTPQRRSTARPQGLGTRSENSCLLAKLRHDSETLQHGDVMPTGASHRANQSFCGGVGTTTSLASRAMSARTLG